MVDQKINFAQHVIIHFFCRFPSGVGGSKNEIANLNHYIFDFKQMRKHFCCATPRCPQMNVILIPWASFCDCDGCVLVCSALALLLRGAGLVIPYRFCVSLRPSYPLHRWTSSRCLLAPSRLIKNNRDSATSFEADPAWEA